MIGGLFARLSEGVRISFKNAEFLQDFLDRAFSGIIMCKSAIVSKCEPKPRQAFDYRDFLPELLNPVKRKEHEKG